MRKNPFNWDITDGKSANVAESVGAPMWTTQFR